ncbi:MAG: DUF3352 domain-containing protein [Leptolyngbya sp. SIO1E4]|nr:DUF3352 domain-containing protein [Leptolyngbya sp. SIO1E4]
MVLAKKPPLLVTIGTALLLMGGGAIAYWGLQWRAAKTRGLPAGVRAVPEEAIAALSLSTNPEQWQRLRQFGTPETQLSFDQYLANWRDRWLTNYDISFNQDVQPWVGPEVTLAWLPDPETNTEDDADVVVLGNQRRLLLLPIADPEAAQVSAESLPLTAESGDQIEYRGVTLSSYPATSGDGNAALWVGVLGTQLILVAEDEATAQQAIDAYKGGKSLADMPGYRRSFEHIGVPQAFGKLYLNVPAVTQMLAQASQPPLPSALLDSFQDSRGIAATLGLASQGVQIKSTSWLGPGSDLAYRDTNGVAQLPEYLPRDTLVMASGGNFQQFWQDFSERRTWGALAAFDPDNLALALQGSTGLTLETDLLPWMSGEFALALVPPQAASPDANEAALPNPGLVALMQVSDRSQAEKSFARLDEVVKNRYRFGIVNEPVGQIDLVKWISPFQAITLSRGWLDSSVAFLTVGTSTEAAIIPPPRRSLATAPLFQLTTADAPRPNNGYFYLNLEALSQTDDNLFLPSTLPVENPGALRAIQAVGIAATVVDEQRLRYDLYVALQRGNRPGPLPPSDANASPSESNQTPPAAETSPSEDSSSTPEATQEQGE